MSNRVVAYTDYMVVGMDLGVLCCESCGALVPHDRRRQHDKFHMLIRLPGNSTKEAAE